MRVISRKKLKLFYDKHVDAKPSLEAWYAETKHATWQSPNEIKSRYASISIVGSNRVVFNIGGNKYRLVVHFAYAHGIAYIRFIGTHRQYDKIDVKTI